MKLFKFLVFSGLLSTSTLLTALESPQSPISLQDICPYVGVDVGARQMSYKAAGGKNLFNKVVPQGNVYIGAQLHEYFALEGGYESTFKKTKTVNFVPGDQGLGFMFLPNDLAEGHTFSEKLKGWHISLIGIAPCLLECDPSLQFFGGIGLSRKKIHLVNNKLNIAGVSISGDETIRTRRTFVKSKSLLRLSCGAQKMVTDYIGVRATINWENTASFGSIKSLENPSGISIVKPKNSFGVGLGVFVKF